MGEFRPSLYMDSPRRPEQGALHCASASRGDGSMGREARGLPRTREAHTQMRCGAACSAKVSRRRAATTGIAPRRKVLRL